MSDEDQPLNEPEKPKRLSFREANLGPEPKPEPPTETRHFFTKRKRTVSIGLIAVGATAAALYAVGHRNSNCDQYPPEQATSCRQSSGNGGGGGGRYFGSSGSSSSSDSHSVSRGGFGSSGSAHGGGGE